MSNIIVICGFSGAGKDTIAKHISEHYNYKMVISTTSRPMRKGEQEGDPYYFVSKEEFLKRIKEDVFIEYRSYNTLLNGINDVWYYGVQRSSLNQNANYIVVLDLQGLIQLKKHFTNVISFFIDVPKEIRKARVINARPDFDEIEWERRVADDNQKFTNNEIEKYVDFKMTNLEFNTCIQKIMTEVERWQIKQTNN